MARHVPGRPFVVSDTDVNRDLPIEVYEQQPAVCIEHDPLTAEVVARVGEALRPHLPTLCVEHVGSTAVPGCAGKGIVDLAVLYPPGQLAAARALVDSLGFQHQPQRDPFPEERPMRVGALVHAGRKYLLHLHIIAADSYEAVELLRFRDRLRAEPALRDAYVARKREILAAGTTDSLDYCQAKADFIKGLLT